MVAAAICLRTNPGSINPDAAALAERDRRNERTERAQAAREAGRPPEREAPPAQRPRPPQEVRPQEVRPQDVARPQDASAGYRPQDMRPQEARPAPRENRDREREPGRPGMAQRRDRGDRDRPERGNDQPRPPQQNNNDGVRGFRDVMADADDLGAAAAQANRSARRTYANVPSPTPEFDRLEPSMEDRSGESEYAAQMAQPRPTERPYSFDELPAEAERYQGRAAAAGAAARARGSRC